MTRCTLSNAACLGIIGEVLPRLQLLNQHELELHPANLMVQVNMCLLHTMYMSACSCSTCASWVQRARLILVSSDTIYRHASAEQCHPFDSLLKLQGVSAVCFRGLQGRIMPILEEDKQICKARWFSCNLLSRQSSSCTTYWIFGVDAE